MKQVFRSQKSAIVTGILAGAAAFGLALLLLISGCANQAPIVLQLPPNASAEHIYLASQMDYEIFSRDVNAYLALPSVTLEQARRIDAIMDRADAEVRRLENLRLAQGAISHGDYSSVAALLQHVARQVCVANPDVSTSCLGR